MSDGFTFDVELASEIKLAAQEAGANAIDLKRLTEGDMFSKVLPVIRGFGEVTVKDLFSLVADVPIGGCERFAARDHIQSANIGFMGQDFQRFFLPKVEEPVADAAIAVYQLERHSYDAAIMAKLGNRAETKLAHFFNLLKMQSQGQKGALIALNDSYVSIAYIRGIDGNLWTIQAHWVYSPPPYWAVLAYPIDRTEEHRCHSRIISLAA